MSFDVGCGRTKKQHPDSRPASYLLLQSLDHRFLGRAVSPMGTFGTSDREGRAPNGCGSSKLYCFPNEKFEHSLGVKRTNPRFQVDHEDISPGPIYKPPVVNLVHAAKFSTAPRFAEVCNERPAKPRAVFSIPSTKQDVKLIDRCTFGSRPKTPLCGADQLAPELSTDSKKEVQESQPRFNDTSAVYYKGKIGTAERKTMDEVPNSCSPHRAAMLRAVHINELSGISSTTPSWSFGRRFVASGTDTPGPGSYKVEKFSRTSKPQTGTFSRQRHSFQLVKGCDSPGPAVYASKDLAPL